MQNDAWYVYAKIDTFLFIEGLVKVVL